MNATYLRHMGDDLCVANNARVSFQKQGQWDELTNGLKISDRRLIHFLARGLSSEDTVRLISHVKAFVHLKDDEALLKVLSKYRKTPVHWAPFANGTTITFHVKAPIPIMRQLFKHKVGAVESEVSRRYVDSDPEFFEPVWREKAENVKQGSGGPHDDYVVIDDTVNKLNFLSDLCYKGLIENGVCPEQARFVLPQSMYTEAVISQSLYGWANVYNHRADATHAQKEISDLTMEISRQIAPLYPISWEALTS